MERFTIIKEALSKFIPSPHHFIVYLGTAGDYGLKISVILNDNESLASLYDNVKEITNWEFPEVKPFTTENVIPKPGLFKKIFGGYNG